MRLRPKPSRSSFCDKWEDLLLHVDGRRSDFAVEACRAEGKPRYLVFYTSSDAGRTQAQIPDDRHGQRLGGESDLADHDYPVRCKMLPSNLPSSVVEGDRFAQRRTISYV